MTRVRDDIKVAYPNAKNVADRWSGSDHPAFSNVQMGDCHLSGVLVLVTDKLYLLEDNKKVIVQQFDLQHLWLTPMNKNNLDWIMMTPNHSVFISFSSQRDADIVLDIVQATRALLASSYHVGNLKMQIGSRGRPLFKSDNAFCPPPPLIQIPLIKGTGAKFSSRLPQSFDKDSVAPTAKKWWDAFFAPTRFVVFLYAVGGSTGDVYIGNMTCGVRSGWGVFICHSLQRMYSCFWRHDKPYGFGRVRECNASGIDISFTGVFEGGQFGSGLPNGPQLPVPAFGHLVKKVKANAQGVFSNATSFVDLIGTPLSQTSDSSFIYTGEFLGGKRSGQGTCVCADGKFKGSWAQDLRHGPGVLVQNARA